MVTKIDKININSTDYDIAVKGENVDGSVAAAATLDNLTATIDELNYSSGLTDNIQSQIDNANKNINDLQNAIIETNSDIIKDTKDGGYKIVEIEGNTEQKQLSGKNLLDCSGLSTQTINGVTFTPVYDSNGFLQYVNVNGTATTEAQYSMGGGYKSIETLGLEVNKSYILYHAPHEVFNQAYFFLSSGNVANYPNYPQDMGAPFVPGATNHTYEARIRVASGKVCNNLKFYPMISVEGGDYEPYCGGVPSPNPAYPQPLLSTGDCVEMGQGYYRANDGIYAFSEYAICNKNAIPCKFGDTIKITLEKTLPISDCKLIFTNENKYIGYYNVDLSNGESLINNSAFSNCTHFYIDIICTEKVTPQTAGKIALTINGKYLGCAKTHSKNLFNINYFIDNNYYSSNGKSLIINKDDYRQYDAIKTFYLKPNTKYVLSVQNPCRLYYGKDFDSAVSTPNTTATYLPFTTSATGISHFKFIADSYPYNVGWVQVEEVEEYREPTEYVPFGESIAYFLTDYPMLKGSSLYKEDGLWKLEHNTHETRLLSEWGWQKRENGYTDSSGGYGFQVTSNDKGYASACHSEYDVAEAMCSHYPIASFYQVYVNNAPNENSLGVFSDGEYAKFRCRNTNVTTLEQLKTWLDENDVRVQYRLATPIIEVLDNESQKVLNNLKTFEGVTHVEFDTRVQPKSFKAKVGTTNEAALVLENSLRHDSQDVQIKELTAAMLALSQL